MVNNDLQERIEQVFDQVWLELAGLSDSEQEFEEILEEFEPGEAGYYDSLRAWGRRYDSAAARLREKFKALRRELEEVG